MKLKEIISIIETYFPTESAMEWDNVGLLLGDREREIKKVLLTLDITYDIIEQAKAAGAELIWSHHPVMFSPVQKITTDTGLGRLLLCASENKINIYASHTNCDVAPAGINAYLAEMFELENPTAIEDSGLGRIGNLKSAMKFSDFARLVCRRLNTPHLRFCGDENRIVKRIAIGSGACADSILPAAEMGADVMITGDLKYHEMLEAAELGINVIDAGHYPTEIVVEDIFKEVLKDTGLELICAKSRDVFRFIREE